MQPTTTETGGSQQQEKIALTVLIVFALIIFLAQSLQFLNSRRIDGKYSKLIADCSYDIRTINGLLVHSSNIQRNALNLLLSENADQKTVFKIKILDNLALDKADIKKLDSSVFALSHQNEKDAIKQIELANVLYISKLDTVLNLVAQNEIEKASDYRLNSLRPTFTNYSDLQKELALQLTKNLIKESDHLTAYTNRSSLTLLLMGFSPIIFILMVLLYFAVRFFRSRRD